MVKDNGLHNAYMVALFVRFGAKSLSNVEKFVQDKNGNPNYLLVDKLFLPNLYKLHNLYILMDFYLVLSRRVCPRSS
jgi:hypothetical protein